MIGSVVPVSDSSVDMTVAKYSGSLWPRLPKHDQICHPCTSVSFTPLYGWVESYKRPYAQCSQFGSDFLINLAKPVMLLNNYQPIWLIIVCIDNNL